MSFFQKFLSLFKRQHPKSEQEIYIGDAFLGNKQRLITRYDDKREIGECGYVKMNPDGTMGKSYITGKMWAQTVKYVGEDGVTKLGVDWVADPIPDHLMPEIYDSESEYKDSCDADDGYKPQPGQWDYDMPSERWKKDLDNED